MSHVIQQINGCSSLRVLDLSCTTLTGCFCSFLPDPHPGLPQLMELNLRRSLSSSEDVVHLIYISRRFPHLTISDLNPSSITQNIRLPNMQDLYLSMGAIVDSMVAIATLGAGGPPTFRYIKWPDLDQARLNKEDLQYLLSIAHKLPKLRELDLHGYTLTGCLSSFLPDPHPGLPTLKKLDLSRTAINEEDVKHIFDILQYNKLPKLQELDLSQNILKGYLSSFLPDRQPRFLKLERLDLTGTAINKEDLRHLCYVQQRNKLPKLWILILSQNTLTGCLCNLLPESYPVTHQLMMLHLANTKLNNEDLHHLTSLIQSQKLPELQNLSLKFNRLSEMETDVEHLIEACVTHHQRYLRLFLYGNDLSHSFMKKWRQQCQGTNVVLEL